MTKYFKNILCIGDSSTSQEWCHPNWIDWLNFVFKQGDNPYKYNVVNSGVDGGTVDIFLENFMSLVEDFHPEIVILSLGFNHLEHTENIEDQTAELIKRIQKINSKVILWSTYETVNPKYSSALNEASVKYSGIAKKFDCKFVDVFNEFKKYDLSKIFTYTHKWENPVWNLKPGDIDFLHCNKIGNQIIAEMILKKCFNLDLSLADEFSGMGNMSRKNLSNYKHETKHES